MGTGNTQSRITASNLQNRIYFRETTFSSGIIIMKPESYFMQKQYLQWANSSFKNFYYVPLVKFKGKVPNDKLPLERHIHWNMIHDLATVLIHDLLQLINKYYTTCKCTYSFIMSC